MVWKLTCPKCKEVSCVTPRDAEPGFHDRKCIGCRYPLCATEPWPDFKLSDFWPSTAKPAAS